MTLLELIDLLEKKSAYISQLKTAAAAIGDVEQVLTFDTQFSEIQTLLSQLKQIPQSV